MLIVGFMLVSTLGKMVINRFSMMLQTEGGYDTCASKRIEIGEHLRYLPMGFFNDSSLGHITSVTTNTMEQVGDIATRAVMMVLQGGITTAVVAVFMFFFDVRIGLISLVGIGIFMLMNIWTNRSVARVAGEKISADKEMVGVILEYIQGISEIRNYNIIGRNKSKIESSIERKRKADIAAELAAIPAVGIQMLISKLAGVAIAGASVYFYLNGTMELVYTITMLLCSFMVFESLDSAGIYTALLRVIGEGGTSLSGGEKQRIAIARAIMKDAPVIVLDEATANVDPENEKELTQAIENLTKQKTIIMIAHRLKTVRNADQILVVDQGKIVQKGKHLAVLCLTNKKNASKGRSFFAIYYYFQKFRPFQPQSLTSRYVT